MLDIFLAKHRAPTEANAGLNKICSYQRAIATDLGSLSTYSQ
jgi:hypothetical protein